MAKLLKGAAVTAALMDKMKQDVNDLKAAGIEPCLCIFRIGERADDLSYERGAVKKATQAGVRVITKALPADVDQETFDAAFTEVNQDPDIHGILLFRPLPKHLDNEKARRMLHPSKDIDGCTDGSLAGVFTDSGEGFPPCTAQAAMAILEHYDIPIQGKKACVIGRSLVIGRPVSMMLMHKNATVVTCHTKTEDPAAIARQADILICAAGRLHSIGPEYTNPSQVIIDVGINWDESKGGISGDCDFDQVAPLVQAITPVPGGVGGVTSTILISHVIEAAKKTLS